MITITNLKKADFKGPFTLEVVVRDGGFTALYPAGQTERIQIGEHFGFEADEDGRTRLPIIFPCRACQFKESGYVGRFLIRLSKTGRTFTAVPDPTVIPILETKEIWDISPRPAPALTFEQDDRGRWIARDTNRVVVLPVKGWKPDISPDNTKKSVLYQEGQLTIRPTLTATIWVAGPEAIMNQAPPTALIVSDEDWANEHRWDTAREYRILNMKMTPFEIVGADFLEAVVDINAFRRDCKTATDRAERWVRVTMARLIHPDMAKALIASYLSDDDLTARKTAADVDSTMEQLVNSLEPGISHVLDETQKEFIGALDDFREWAKWAETEFKRRNRLGLKMTAPPPYGRLPRAVPLINWSTEGVAERVKKVIAQKQKEQSKPNRVAERHPVVVTDEVRALVTPREFATLRSNGVRPNLKAAAQARRERRTEQAPEGNGFAIADTLAGAVLAAKAAQLNGGNTPPAEPPATETTPSSYVRCAECGKRHRRPAGFIGNELETCPKKVAVTA